MKAMALRASLLSLIIAAASMAATATTIRGKLTEQSGTAAIETTNHQFIHLTGDAATQKILRDERVSGMDLEVKGHFTSNNEFAVDPIEDRAILVHKGEHLYRVTYYCDTCSIRTYEPGRCLCCQEETRLDLIDPKQGQ
jgi:hypothetical protein